MQYLDYKKDKMAKGNILAPYLVKRKAFEGEKEVRAIRMLPPSLIKKRIDRDLQEKHMKLFSLEINEIKDRAQLIMNGKYVPVEVEKLVEKVYVDPRAEEWVRKTVESVLHVYGASKEVVKSKLYSAK